tara:strand:- start:3271 stop:4632 length:1362 start_codon:yes stop_codon:yes gene_type:complete
MKAFNVFRSTAFQWGSLFMVTFTVATWLLFAFLYYDFKSEFEENTKDLIERQRSLFLASRNRKASQHKKNNIQMHGDFVYLLVDKEGDRVDGNIVHHEFFSGWKVLSDAQLPWLKKKAVNKEEGFLAKWVKLPEGALLVGYSNRALVETEETLQSGLTFGVLLSLLLALGGGLYLANRTNRQLTLIKNVLASIAKGDVKKRIPVQTPGNDLDQIAAGINAMQSQLQIVLENMRDVSTNIAHDLKTPLTRLRQKLEFANESANHEDFDESIIHDIDGIVETFDALLRIAQVEMGTRKSGFSRVDLVGLLADLEDVYQAVAEDYDDELVVKFGQKGPVFVFGDKDLLTQMFVNLIENSIRHSPSKTLIVLQLQETEWGPEFTIADNGPGIPEAERKKVWRRLYRLEKSRTTPGSGLGLSLVKAIASLHEASLALEDNHPGLLVRVQFSHGGHEGK